MSHKTIVIKLGTRVLMNKRGRPNLSRIQALVAGIAKLHADGVKVVLVSSGAIGAGMQVLNLKGRPRTIQNLQMAAAVGQCHLLALYQQCFAKHKITISQVLLTHDDVRHKVRKENAKNALLNSLSHGIVPIVNENDAVAMEEIEFGDNDLLSAYVAELIEADQLQLLTSAPGLLDYSKGGKPQRIKIIEKITPSILAHAKPHNDSASKGGMESKLLAAKRASSAGVEVVIADGQSQNIIVKVAHGKDAGTRILGCH